MSELAEQVPRVSGVAETGSRPALWVRGNLPFLLASAVYLATTLLLLLIGWRLSDRHLVYPLDDVYINMAVAKNFALHGVWGVTPYEFSSCTSSPLYVLLLAGVYRLFGVNAYAPVMLSWSFGLGAVFVAAGMLRLVLEPIWQTTVLIAMVLLVPMFVVGNLGMEHTLHLLLALMFLRCFESARRPLWLIALLTAGMVGTRYEGLLMAVAAVLVLLVQRRWLRAAVFGVSAWVPVGVYAGFSIAHGGDWLPNSVLLKGVRVHGASGWERLGNIYQVTLDNMQHAPHLPLLLLAMAAMLLALRRVESKSRPMLAVVAGAGLLHLMTADVGWAFRYEAYLLGVGLVAIACAWVDLPRSSSRFAVAATYIAMGCAVGMLLLRAVIAGVAMPQYSRAIYQQQWQTAEFLKSFYPGGAVAANDIGAIDYRVDLHCLDLAGLASREIFQAKRDGDYSTEALGTMAAARGVQVAVLYDLWFSAHPITPLGGPPVPGSWIRVRRWTVPERLQLGAETVSFYALDPARAELLKAQLDAFQERLPKAIAVSY